MNVDLSPLTVEELEAVIVNANAMIAQHQTKKHHQAYLNVLQIASEQGMSIEELLTVGRRAEGRAKPAMPVKKVEARYRNPENHTETWTGRGRTPLWLAARLAEGENLADFLIAR